MRELVRIELPAPLFSRGRGSKSVVRTKSGHFLAAPTSSSLPPSVSECTPHGTSDVDRSSRSSVDTVMGSSSVDSSDTNNQQFSSQNPPSVLQVDTPIKEVSDMDETSATNGYESDDSLKDLNWLGGLNPNKICQSKPPISSKAKRAQSPRRVQTASSQNLSAPSPRNRPGSTVAPYMKRVNAVPTAGTALSPIRQSSPIHQIEPVGQTQPTTAALMTSSVPVSHFISQPSWVNQQRETKRLNRLKRPPFSYVALCCMALASSDTLKLHLTQIYKWIEDAFPYYAKPECYQDWRSSIRHTLSLYSFFQSMPVIVGRKTIPTWRLDITESERLDLGRLVKEFAEHQNSQFISEWTSRLVYAEQKSHRRGTYDRQASKFKAFSALRSRSSSTDTLTSTHSTSTSATGGYHSYTPDSAMSSTSGSVQMTGAEVDISVFNGAMNSISSASTGQPSSVFQSSASVVYCNNGSSNSTSKTSPAQTTTAYETGPGITIIRIPPNAPKFGLLVLAPRTRAPILQQQQQQQQQTQSASPAAPMSVASENSSAPLFDLTNNQCSQSLPQVLPSPTPASSAASVVPIVSGFSEAAQFDHRQQYSLPSQPVELNVTNEINNMTYWKDNQQYSTETFNNQQQYLSMEQSPLQISLERLESSNNNGNLNTNCNFASSTNNNNSLTQEALEDFGSSMDLDLSLNDLGVDLFTDNSNIDFGCVFEGTLDTPRNDVLPSDDTSL